MINVNESELKGKITTETVNGITAVTESGSKSISFKEELDKLASENVENGLIDPSSLLSSAILNPVTENGVISDENINNVFDVGETYKYDTKKIENADAMFFLNVSSNSDTINIKFDNDTVIDASNYKTMEVSKTLSDLIAKSQETNKSLRLDFDDHVTVVLKVSKEGKIDTTFIPQDRQVEQYLKNNIDYLKVRFDEQSIAYSNISYKPYRQKNSNKQGDK